MLNVQNNVSKVGFTPNNAVNFKGNNEESQATVVSLPEQPERDVVEITGKKEESSIVEQENNVYNLQKDDGTDLTLQTKIFKGQTMTGKIGNADVDLKNKIKFFRPRQRSLQGTINGQEVNLQYKIDKEGNMIFDEETQEKYGDVIDAFKDLNDFKAEKQRARMLSWAPFIAAENMRQHQMSSQLFNDQLLQQQLLNDQIVQQQNQLFMDQMLQHNSLTSQQMIGMM